MNPEEFSDALDDALPPKPTSKGWGVKARRRSRNRRAAALTGVAGALAVAVLAVTVQLTGQPTMTATPMPAETPTEQQGPTPLEPDACEGVGTAQYRQELPEDGLLPEGAQRVWLCGGQGVEGIALVGAAEPLTTNVEAAVAAFNAEPTSFAAIDCDGVNSEAFHVIYDYPDGTRYEALVQRGRCAAVSIGSRLRFEPEAYFDAITSLWEEQRMADGPTFVPGSAVCPDKSSVFDVSPNDAVSGFICTVPDDAAGESQQVQLSDELVADIAAEIEESDWDETPNLDRSKGSLVLLNEHGDPFTIFGTPEHGYLWYPPRNAGGIQVWFPNAEMQERMLAEMERALGPTEPPTTSAYSDPTDTVGSQPPGPPEPDPAATGSTDAYTEQELQYGLGVLLDSLNGEDPGEFSAVMSRATFRDAWNIASSDVWLAEYPLPDDAPVLVIRITGPVDASNAVSPRSPEVPRGAGFLIILDATTGSGVGGGATYMVRDDGEPSGPPPVNPATETDVVQLTIPDPEGSAPDDLQLRAAQECRDIFSEFAPDTAASTLPESPTQVWLCLSYAPQLAGPGWTGYGLVADADGAAQAAADAFNSLDVAAEACRGGWAGLVAYDYADGSRHVVAVTDGCQGVALGESHRDGANEYIATLRQLWDQSVGHR